MPEVLRKHGGLQNRRLRFDSSRVCGGPPVWVDDVGTPDEVERSTAGDEEEPTHSKSPTLYSVGLVLSLRRRYEASW